MYLRNDENINNSQIDFDWTDSEDRGVAKNWAMRLLMSVSWAYDF
jgi:hypothetical protein